MQTTELIHTLNRILRDVIDYQVDNYFDSAHPLPYEKDLDELMDNLAILPNVIESYRKKKQYKSEVNTLISNSKA